ncbi:G1/S-specific cyclin-D3-like [Bombyx mandarina]|uniref:G1/S-specific cyclin-D3-like n=1 Tax=Bombyx mandarina TaxID=7092 RepID=A0A6J2JJ35_BOMMA|nr:G1/S-specific cyclin-D3-like [Bombyx mandarina]
MLCIIIWTPSNGRNLRAGLTGTALPPRRAAPIICSVGGRVSHRPLTATRALVVVATLRATLRRSLPTDQLSSTPRRTNHILRDAYVTVRINMELLCAERVSPGSGEGAPRLPQAAAPDPVLLRRRVLDNLLRTEERYAVTANYFGTVQTEITPHMRRLVAEWMLEVCEDRGCQEEVFPLAISFLDRFLSICAVGKSQVQLLGTACLLLASKLREPGSCALPADLLVFYTANSITLTDLCSWELLVLSKLKWDVAGVTAHDFLPLLLSRLPIRGLVNVEMVQRHAKTFISLAARDYEFTLYSSSTLAACSIAAALRGLEHDGYLSRLQELTRIDLDCLQTCLEQIEDMVQSLIVERDSCPPNGQAREAAGWTPPPAPPHDKAHSNAATPTDVRDVHF